MDMVAEAKRPLGRGSVRTLVISSQQLVAAGIAALVGDEASFQVVGVVADTERLWEVVEACPDLVIIDTDIADKSPFTLAEEISTRCPRARISFVSRASRSVTTTQALRSGAHGFFLLSDSPQRLLEGLQRVANGEYAFSPEIAPHVVTDAVTGVPSGTSESNLMVLTDRQLEVLRLLAKGMSVKQVARLMSLSEKSVDSHKYRIMNRLGIHDRVELALFAVREGLIEP